MQHPLRDQVRLTLDGAASCDHSRGECLQEISGNRAPQAPAMVLPSAPKLCSFAATAAACPPRMPAKIWITTFVTVHSIVANAVGVLLCERNQRPRALAISAIFANIAFGHDPARTVPGAENSALNVVFFSVEQRMITSFAACPWMQAHNGRFRAVHPEDCKVPDGLRSNPSP